MGIHYLSSVIVVNHMAVKLKREADSLEVDIQKFIIIPVIVSQRIIMSIIEYNTKKRLLYNEPPTRSNRHVHRLFTCSNSPNIDARTSAILVGTSKQVLLKPYECLQMVMSPTVRPKSRTYPHFRDLDNNQIEELPPQVFHNNSQLVVL